MPAPGWDGCLVDGLPPGGQQFAINADTPPLGFDFSFVNAAK